MKYKAYKNYKSSNINYLPKLPNEWNIMNMKYLISNIQTGSTPSTKNEDYFNGNIQWFTPGDFTEQFLIESNKKITETAIKDNEAKLLRRGTVCIVGIGATLGKVAILKNESSFNQQITGINVNKKLNNRYLYYWLLDNKERINKIANYTTLPIINNEFLKNLKVFVPSVEEQEKIVEFLDKKTSEINELIEEKETLIKLLKEKREAIITEAVTKGLDKNVKMKDSGVEWIGVIPEEWKCIKIKYIFDIVKNIAGKTGFNILSVTQRGIKIKDISKNDGQISMDYSKYQIVHIGDFIMNHMDLLTGWVDCSKYLGVTSPDYRVFRIKDDKKFSREYYKYIMQLCYSTKIFYGLGQGVSNLGRWRLQTDKFKEFKVPVPSKKEQYEIVNFIENRCKYIDYICENIIKEIAFLEEYKESVISEVVTGKIDVRSY
ncbi:restriction endonuclease subunit S [Clostridium sp.]|uniref:restriction endonuclease subunit S n=1 Tax=Clostridium sp. TaxID=1506 RepID=UPI002FC847D5